MKADSPIERGLDQLRQRGSLILHRALSSTSMAPKKLLRIEVPDSRLKPAPLEIGTEGATTWKMTRSGATRALDLGGEVDRTRARCLDSSHRIHHIHKPHLHPKPPRQMLPESPNSQPLRGIVPARQVVDLRLPRDVHHPFAHLASDVGVQAFVDGVVEVSLGSAADDAYGLHRVRPFQEGQGFLGVGLLAAVDEVGGVDGEGEVALEA